MHSRHATAPHPWEGSSFGISLAVFLPLPILYSQIQARSSLPPPSFPLLNPSPGTISDNTGIKGSGSRFKNLSKAISFPLVIKLWNSLSGDVLGARNTYGFKGGLDKLTEDRSAGSCYTEGSGGSIPMGKSPRYWLQKVRVMPCPLGTFFWPVLDG